MLCTLRWGGGRSAPELVEQFIGCSGKVKVSTTFCLDAFCGSNARCAQELPLGSVRSIPERGVCRASASPHLVVTPSGAGEKVKAGSSFPS